MTELAYGTDTPEQPATEDTGAPSLAYGSALPTAPALSETDLNRRVARADFALADKSPGSGPLKDAFRSGDEGSIRAMAAGQADAEFRQEKLNVIQAAATSGAPIDGKTVDTLMAVGTTPEANPNTVIEDKFSKNFTNAAIIGDPEKNLVFQSAFDTNPTGTQENVKRSIAAGSRHHIVRGVLEDAEAEYATIPWVSFGNPDQQDKLGNLAKSVLTGGISSYVNQRNLLNESPNNSILPGSNKLEQIQYLFLLPPDQIRPALMAAAGPGSDLWKKAPTDAVEFIKAAVQFSASDAYIDNVMGVVNVGSMIPFGSAVRSIGLLRKGSEAAVDMTRVQTAFSAANDVLKTSSKAPETAGSRAANVAEGILRESPAPAPSGYYVPAEAVEKFGAVKDLSGVTKKGQARAGEVVLNDQITLGEYQGTPFVQDQNGSYVGLSRVPTEGSYPVHVSEPSPINTYANKEGIHNFPGPEDNVVFADKKGWERLSSVLDEDQNYRLLSNDKGQYYVAEQNGKRIPNTLTKVQTEPAEGLHPIRIPEGNDKSKFEDFGSRITHINREGTRTVTLGPKIVPQSEIETRIALADTAKAQAADHPVDALSKMGQHEVAATVKAQTDLANRFNEVVQSGDVEAIRRNVPSLASPQVYYQNSSSLTTERARRLADEAVLQSSEIGAAIIDPQRVERLTAEALNRGIEAAKDVIKVKFNRNSDAILDQATVWDSASNTYKVQSKLGKKDGTLFDSSIEANHYRTFQYRLGSSATVEQEGSKFYLSHIQHANETAAGVREGLIVAENQTPRGIWNTIFSGVTGRLTQFGASIRSSRYTQSEFQMNNRITATHAPSVMKEVLEQTGKDLGELGRWTTAERHELQRILEHNRDFMNPDGTRGQFYKSALEFENAFHSMFGKMPTEKQIVAYDQFTRLSDLDWVLRELDWHRDKVRQGVRNYQLPYTKEENGIPQKGMTDWFNGKKVDNFDPVNTQNANIYIMPEGRFTTKFDLKKETVEDLLTQTKIKDGKYQIIQVYNPGGKPLKEATGVKDNIHFVVVDKYDDKALLWGENSVYRPGGHVIYEDPFFMKVPQIGTGTLGRLTHFGDTTVKSFATPKEGQMWVDRYNTARELLHKGDEAGLKAYIDAGNLPETLPEFKKMFTAGGFDLNAEHPFVLTTTGRNTFESSEELARAYPGLKDTFSSYDLTQTQGSKFLAERDKQLSTIANKGTEENPIYANVPSRLYDPFTSLQKGMAQIVRERWMGDQKISAAESWIQEFGMLFDQSKLPLEKLRQNPVYWLYHAQGNINMGIAKTNPELISAAMVSRQNILNFIGARDEVGAVIEGLERKIIEMTESVGGKRAAQIVEERLLPGITSAPEYARKAAFHSVIGLFNPVQLFQQAQGLAHVLALSPVNGLKGSTASALARLFRYTEDPAVLSSMFDKASAMGWDRGHIAEAYDAWKRSGVHNIGGETATLSSVEDVKLFQGTGSWILDKGLMFFKAGESIVRDTAYFTAYQDWRAANPTAVLNNRAMGDIGRRFDTLSMNMTRASNAAYNEGILSVPTQFWTWNARLVEQMAGKQLTMAEKARVFALYSTLYGVPATLGGITFGVIPMANYQDIRQYALTNGYNVSNKFFQAFSEGLPAMLTNAITGHDTDFQRFSPNATQIKDIIDGKKSALETLGGASGGFLQKMMDVAYPAYMFGLNAFKKDGGFPLTGNDLLSLGEVISTFNNGEKAFIGLSLGQYIAKNENKVLKGNVDTFDSIMLGLGLQPKRASDAYSILDYAKHQKAAQDKLAKPMTEYWKIAMRAGAQGDTQTMATYMTRVAALSAAGNFTKKQEIELFQKASKDSTDLVDAANRWMLNNNKAMQSVPKMQEYLESIRNRR